MGEDDPTRLIAWHHEMTTAHARLREALQVTRESVEAGTEVPAAERDLLLFCHGFCVALSDHHRGEDQVLFGALMDRHPALADVLGHLRQDHSMIEHLLHALRAALDRGDPPEELRRHLDGIDAIMESHFRYEERELVSVLAGLELDVDPRTAFGTL